MTENQQSKGAIELALSGRLRFGTGAAQEFEGANSALYRDPAIVVADADSVTSGTSGPVIGALSAISPDPMVVEMPGSDPTPADIDALVARIAAAEARTIIGLGGPSAIVAAKLAAAMSDSGRSVQGRAPEALPDTRTVGSVAIPTIAGTGAAVMRTVEIRSGDGTRSKFQGDQLRPDVVILDPSLSRHVSAEQTATSGVDALVYAVEACTNLNASPLVDAWAFHAIRLVIETLPRVVAGEGDGGGDGSASDGLVVAAALAGLAADANGCGVARALGAALSTMGKIAPGRAVALALRVALDGNAVHAIPRHARVARVMGHWGEDDEQLAYRLSERFDAFLQQVGIEISLSGDGLGVEQTQLLADRAMAADFATDRETNCRPVTPELMLDLARAVLTSD